MRSDPRAGQRLRRACRERAPAQKLESTAQVCCVLPSRKLTPASSGPASTARKIARHGSERSTQQHTLRGRASERASERETPATSTASGLKRSASYSARRREADAARLASSAARVSA